MKQVIKTVFLEKDRLFIIDQRFLPQSEKIIELKNESEIYEAIRNLSVRGAPAIGITAAYGAYVSLASYSSIKDIEEYKEKGREILEFIGRSRPTAYNLFYVIKKFKAILDKSHGTDEILTEWKREAFEIHREDLFKSDEIAKYGSPVIGENAKIITHCNAGGLATGGNGTALSVIFKAHEEGKRVFVYACETRPMLQGSRLTAWELEKTGVPYKLICDNMAASIMAKEEIDLVIVGADRIALNGDFANKIGTYSLAVLAKYHGVPFYTAAPLTTFDPDIENGDLIPIEERDIEEVTKFRGIYTAPENANAYNPAFDVTPNRLLTGIITECGIIYPPFDEKIREAVKGN